MRERKREDEEEKKVGVTLEELQMEREQTVKKDLVMLGTVMGVKEVEREEDEDADDASDTSSQAEAMLLQTQATVSFDRFAQWFLGLARELGHRAGGRQGRRKGGRAGG